MMCRSNIEVLGEYLEEFNAATGIGITAEDIYPSVACPLGTRGRQQMIRTEGYSVGIHSVGRMRQDDDSQPFFGRPANVVKNPFTFGIAVAQESEGGSRHLFMPSEGLIKEEQVADDSGEVSKRVEIVISVLRGLRAKLAEAGLASPEQAVA